MNKEVTVEKRTRGQRGIKRQSNPVDVHVGARLRLRRTLIGLSQSQLGRDIGLTFQQVQKYERGANRIGASRLYDLASILDVPVSFFFDDMPEEIKQKTPEQRRQTDAKHEADPMHRRETLELVRAYYRIIDPGVRKKFFELVKAMGAGEANEEVMERRR